MSKNIAPNNIAQIIVRGLFAALLLIAIPVNSALAGTYEIKLFPIMGVIGTGGFQFDNNSGAGCLATSNPSLMIDGETLAAQNQFCVQVLDVDFSDNKTTAPDGPNMISGQFVEGLNGTLEDGSGNTISFFLGVNGSNPNNFIRVYNGFVNGQQVVGNYAVTNQLNTVPEPGILALFGFGLGTLVWVSRKRYQGRYSIPRQL